MKPAVGLVPLPSRTGIDPYALWASNTAFNYCQVEYVDVTGTKFVKFIAEAACDLKWIKDWLAPSSPNRPDWIKIAPDYINSRVFDDLSNCHYFTGFIRIDALEALLSNQAPAPTLPHADIFWERVSRLQLAADVRADNPFIGREEDQIREAFVPPEQARFLANYPNQAGKDEGYLQSKGRFQNDDKKVKPFTFVGLIDIGVPFANRECRNWQISPVPKPSTARLRAYWDQGVSSKSPFPPKPVPFGVDGFGYGREWVELPPGGGAKKASVSQLVADVQDVTTEEERYVEADNPLALRARSHGAATLGELCSNRLTLGKNKTDSDIAGFVPLLAVQLPRPTLAHSSLGALAAHVLDGLRWLAGRAGKNNRLVANISLGTQAGPHDGSSILECAIDELIRLRRTIADPDRLAVAMAAGNSREAQCHAKFDIPEKGPKKLSKKLRMRVLPDSAVPVYLEIWLPKNSDVSVSIKTPTGFRVSVDLGNMFHKYGAATRKVSFGVYNMCRGSALGNGRVILLAIAPTSYGLADSGDWTIALSSTAKVSDCHAYVERNNSMFDLSRPRGRQARLIDSKYIKQGLSPIDQSDTRTATIKREGTLNSIATGREVVVAGAYVAKTQSAATYASSGPTRNIYVGVDAGAVGDVGRAPKGVRVLATRSTDTTRLNGTSIAAPRLARHVVNYLAGNYIPFQVKDHVFALSDQSKPPNYDELRLGNGLLSEPRVEEPRLKYD